MVKRKIIVGVLVLFMVSMCQISYAHYSGFSGVSTYTSTSGSCVHGDRAGADYVSNLRYALRYHFDMYSSPSFIYTNSTANENNVKTDAIVNAVDFYAYSGHGHNETTESTLHFFSRSSGESWHNSTMEDYDSVNARTNEVRFGHNRLKWINTYSCNWLTNGGSSVKQTNIFNTFEGATLVMGFASVMFLDSREGTEFGNNIEVAQMSFRRAFIEAAKKYQVQRTTGDSIARVEGYTQAKDDTYQTYQGVLPSNLWYTNSPSSYSIIETVTIPHTGNSI